MSTRQLAAIMFTDIVGYTRLMEDDEANALVLLQKVRRKLEEEIAQHNGRILELRGDGALCSFRSTIEGVKAAIGLQVAMQADPKVPLRVALHTGDIIMQQDAIYGDGVNIASRIETLAVPGSIFISTRVCEDIKNQRDIRTISMGRFKLKNVREEMELHAIDFPGIVVPEAPSPDGKGRLIGEKCILVLPFVNMSNDPGQEYFSDGLTEELISSLSKLKDIRVISRTTSMRYKGSKEDIREISAATGATYIIEGSVRSHRNQLRISTQIVDALIDQHLWSDSFQGTMDDIFDIQEQVARRLAEALQLHLTGEEQVKLEKRNTKNLEAYKHYLQGRYFWNKRTHEGLESSIPYFEKALAIDPDFALAWVGLADTYLLLGLYPYMEVSKALSLAKNAADKALAIDPELAEAHISLAGCLKNNIWDWDKVETEFKIGLDLNPNYATGHQWYSELLLYKGKLDEALHEINLAAELDPISVAIVTDQALTHYYCKSYGKAIEKAKQALDMDPNYLIGHRILSLCYIELGRFEEALMENSKWSKMFVKPSRQILGKAYIHAISGQKEMARQLLSRLSMSDLIQNDSKSIALIHLALGDKEEAYKWLEKSLDQKESAMQSLNVDPKLEPIRKEERFIEILARLGLVSPVHK